jgi:hypothetical protein
LNAPAGSRSFVPDNPESKSLRFDPTLCFAYNIEKLPARARSQKKKTRKKIFGASHLLFLEENSYPQKRFFSLIFYYLKVAIS